MKEKRDCVEYTQTGHITGKLTINGQAIKACKFEFEHTALEPPKAVITLVDPNVVISTIDCDIVKKGIENARKS